MGRIIAWGFPFISKCSFTTLCIYCLDTHRSHVRTYVLSPNYIRAWIFNKNMNNSQEREEVEGLWLAWITRHLNKSENPFLMYADTEKETMSWPRQKNCYKLTLPCVVIASDEAFDNGSMNVCFQKRISRKRRSAINGKRKRSIRPNKFTAIRFVLSWHFEGEWVRPIERQWTSAHTKKHAKERNKNIEHFFFSADGLRIIKFLSQKMKI